MGKYTKKTKKKKEFLTVDELIDSLNSIKYGHFNGKDLRISVGNEMVRTVGTTWSTQSPNVLNLEFETHG